MEQQLILKPVLAYKVIASVDERGPYEVKGYWQDQNAATIASKKAGWWGSDGEVKEVTLFQDNLGILYEVKQLSAFQDDEEGQKHLMLANIKAKLTPEEWAFYHNYNKQK
jgi:hypothetical protein